MAYSIQTLSIGKPTALLYQGKEIVTGFVKQPVDGAVFLSELGMEGDGQADLKNHGGKEKAVLFYPYAHYSFWEQHYTRAFSLPSFGENITISELTEDQVNIGTVFQVGDALVQVCQPRNPCYKIAAFHQLKDITSLVRQTGYSGFYAKVLKEGMIYPDSEVIVKEPGDEQLTVAEVFQVSAQSSNNMVTIDKILNSKYAAVSLKEELQKKKEKLLQ